jgi:hypothetical protein
MQGQRGEGRGVRKPQKVENDLPLSAVLQWSDGSPGALQLQTTQVALREAQPPEAQSAWRTFYQ